MLRCAEGSVAFVETEVGSGTGVVVGRDGKHFLLTKPARGGPHPPPPTPPSRDATTPSLSVLGIDAQSDIALLGPLTGADLPRGLELAAGDDLERGDGVFLVGYPAESQPDVLEATITSGIVSRLRKLAEFDKSSIHADASIAGGQSRGPLLDSTGRLVGLSGLSFAEESST